MNGAETSTDSISDELEAAFGAETPTDAAPEADATAQETPVSGEATAAIEAPKHWPDADKGLFAKAPPDIQKRWLERDKDYTKGFDAKAQELAKLQRYSQSFDELFSPYGRDLELNGLTRQQFVSQLLGAHKYLQDSPKDALKWLAQQYGVDIAALTGQQVDPQTAKVDQRFESLETKLNGFASAQAQAEHQSNLGKVNNFAEAKDDKGNLLHPHFDEVAADVVAIMKSGVTKDLEVAYAKAVRLNDGVWEKVQAEKATAKAAADKQTRQAEIDKAKRAGVTSEAREKANGAARPANLRQDLEVGFANWGG